MQEVNFRANGTTLLKWLGKDPVAIVPEGITYLYDYAFLGCGHLQKILLPESVKKIGFAVFQACRKLEQINLPEKLESIGDAAFNGCTALRSLHLPPNLRKIPPLMCNDCKALTQIVFSRDTEQIGWKAFSGCEAITTLPLPPGLTWIGEGAFAKCRKLTHILLPNALNRLEKGAFSGSDLRTLEFPEGMHRIDFTALADCDTIEMVIVGDPNAEFLNYEDGDNVPLYIPRPRQIPRMCARNMLRGYARMWQAGKTETSADRFYTEYIQNRPKTVFLWAITDPILLDLLAKKRLIPVLLAEEYIKVMTERQNNEIVAVLVNYLGHGGTDGNPFDPTQAFRLD